MSNLLHLINLIYFYFFKNKFAYPYHFSAILCLLFVSKLYCNSIFVTVVYFLHYSSFLVSLLNLWLNLIVLISLFALFYALLLIQGDKAVLSSIWYISFLCFPSEVSNGSYSEIRSPPKSWRHFYFPLFVTTEPML